MKNIKYFCLILICLLLLPATQVFAKINAVSTYHYFYDTNNNFTRSEIDHICSVGEMLSVQNVDLIFNVSRANPSSGNTESKNIFYTYMRDVDYSKQSTEKKVVVMSYYIDEEKLYVYDDYGIIDSEFIDKLNEKLKKFKTVKQMNVGILTTYEYMAQYLNQKLSLGVTSVSDIQIYDPFVESGIISFKNASLCGIIIIILLGSRRNKKYHLEQ